MHWLYFQKLITQYDHVWNIKVISSTDLSHTWFMLIKLIGFKLHCSHTEIVNVKRVPIKYYMWMYIYVNEFYMFKNIFHQEFICMCWSICIIHVYKFTNIYLFMYIVTAASLYLWKYYDINIKLLKMRVRKDVVKKTIEESYGWYLITLEINL